MKSVLVFVVGVLSFLYLIYPSLGIFELIPDPIPFVGNVDEATATAILISALAYFGIDIGGFFGKKKSTSSHVD